MFNLRTAAAVVRAAGLALLLTSPFCARAATAEDRVILKTGEQQSGQVLGVKDGHVQLAIVAGPTTGKLSFRLEQISRVEADPPPGFREGVAAFEAGDSDRALRALEPVAESFRGLPTDWARQAAALLGDLYVEKGDLARAEAAYAEYAKVYGGAGVGSARAQVGLARLALAKGDRADAKARLEPVAAAALKNPVALPRADAVAAGQACLLLGQLAETVGDTASALTHYLRTVALFYEDRAAVAAAQKAADALRAAHPGLIAPP